MRLTNLIPMLETNDLSETIRFYTEKLGFACQNVWPDAEHPCWVTLGNGAVELMFTLRNEHRREFTATAAPLLTGSLYFYPDDVDAVWAQLKDLVTVEYPLETFDYGMREFGIRDCNGYLLQFGQEANAEIAHGNCA